MKFPVRFAALALFGAAALATPAKADDKIGFIYVGPAADFGYNTSMDLGRQYVEKHMPGVTTTAFELIPETAEVERVMERLIASGHKIIFATSYGYLDYAIKVGEKHPDVTILHAGGLKTSKNVGTYWADSDAGMYLAGVTAAHVSKSGKLGFQGGFQIPQLMRSVNAFTLGAQSVNPKITTTVVWNGGWWEPQKETEATNAFADLGIDVIAEQVDSPITIAQAAEKRGIFMIGKDVDIHDRAPKAMHHRRVVGLGPDDGRRDQGDQSRHLEAVEHARRPRQRQRCARSVRHRGARGRAEGSAQAQGRYHRRQEIDLGRPDHQAGRNRRRAGRPEAVDGAGRDHGLSGQRRHRRNEVVQVRQTRTSAKETSHERHREADQTRSRWGQVPDSRGWLLPTRSI